MKVNLSKYFRKEKLLGIFRKSNLPVFVYSKDFLNDRCKDLHSVKFKNGFLVRYAVKANSNLEIIRFLDSKGVHFDASSIYEVDFLIKKCKINPAKISLSSQQPLGNIAKELNPKVVYHACSMLQLENFCKNMKTVELGLRVNPGIGSGGNKRTTTGGVASSFGLWHEYLGEALMLADQHQKKITKLHLHIGSGSDSKIWGEVMDVALEIVNKMPDVTKLDIGGGYKIRRYGEEQETYIKKVLKIFQEKFIHFEKKTGRKIQLEIEPGTFMVGHAGVLLTKVVDVVDTGKEGFNFIKTNTGMNDILRPSLYGAQHEIEVVNNSKVKKSYVVVGHNCESGDVLTTKKGDPEVLEPRLLKKPSIGDMLIIYDVGAYCYSMSAKNYNQYPDALEILI